LLGLSCDTFKNHFASHLPSLPKSHTSSRFFLSSFEDVLKIYYLLSVLGHSWSSLFNFWEHFEVVWVFFSFGVLPFILEEIFI